MIGKRNKIMTQYSYGRSRLFLPIQQMFNGLLIDYMIQIYHILFNK